MDGGGRSKVNVARTQAVAYVRLPDVRLNVNGINVADPLYKGVSRGRRGIRLFNGTRCDLVYSWGNPVGSHANCMDCAFKPANGTVSGNSYVEFELVMTPKTAVSIITAGTQQPPGSISSIIHKREISCRVMIS